MAFCGRIFYMRLHIALLVIFSVLALTVIPGCSSGGKKHRTSKPDALLALINDLRNSSSVPALTVDPKIEDVAGAYSQQFYAYLAGPPVYSVNVDGSTLNDRFNAGEITFTTCAETGVVDCTSTTAAIARPKLNQSTILSASYTRVGIGFDDFVCPLCTVNRHHVYAWIVDLAN
jgi:L-fucose isomerase-like protein